MNPDHHCANFINIGNECVRADRNGLIPLVEGTRRHRHVSPLQSALHFDGCHPKPCHALRVELDAYFSGPSADNGRARNILDTLEPGQYFLTDAMQFVVVVVLRIKGYLDDGNVINCNRLDHPTAHAGRHLIDVHIDFVVQAHHGLDHVLPNIEAHSDNGHIAPGHGVDILDPVDLPQEPLKGCGDQFFDFFRTGAGKLDKNISQGDYNLRVFLSRGDDDGRSTKAQGEDQKNDGHLRVEKFFNDSGDHPDFFGLCRIIHRALSRVPASRCRQDPKVFPLCR